MSKTRRQRSLSAWGKQKWRTKSGKKSSETGERYLPSAAIKALSDKEYAATTRKKREDTKKGKQHSKQPKKIAKKTVAKKKVVRKAAPAKKKAAEPEVNMGKGVTSVTCPSCEKTHHVEENTTKFICSCGRRIRV